jgi:hypothetical protein
LIENSSSNGSDRCGILTTHFLRRTLFDLTSRNGAGTDNRSREPNFESRI